MTGLPTAWSMQEWLDHFGLPTPIESTFARRGIEVSLAIKRNTAGRFDYVVTTTSGYRAVIEKCDRDDCASGVLPECRTKLDDRKQHDVNGRSGYDWWRGHAARYCHGWHDGRIADFVASVAKLYGSYRRFGIAPPSRPKLGPMKIEHIADALDITVDEYRAELAKAAA